MTAGVRLVTLFCATLAFGTAGAEATTVQEGAGMSNQAKGSFEVRITPLSKDEKVPGLAVGRLAFDKQFQGDFEGASKGEMMTTETSVKDSGGYVAVEQVSGKLLGRRGSFALLHQATMRQGGDLRLSIIVVPDSGTEELAGLTGTMTIIIKDGRHFYQFDYALPQAP